MGKQQQELATRGGLPQGDTPSVVSFEGETNIVHNHHITDQLQDPVTSDAEASKGRDSGLRLLQTLAKWLFSSLAGPGLVRAPGSHLFSLLPYLLSHEW